MTYFKKFYEILIDYGYKPRRLVNMPEFCFGCPGKYFKGANDLDEFYNCLHTEFFSCQDCWKSKYKDEEVEINGDIHEIVKKHPHLIKVQKLNG